MDGPKAEATAGPVGRFVYLLRLPAGRIGPHS